MGQKQQNYTNKMRIEIETDKDKSESIGSVVQKTSKWGTPTSRNMVDKHAIERTNKKSIKLYFIVNSLCNGSPITVNYVASDGTTTEQKLPPFPAAEFAETLLWLQELEAAHTHGKQEVSEFLIKKGTTLPFYLNKKEPEWQLWEQKIKDDARPFKMKMAAYRDAPAFERERRAEIGLYKLVDELDELLCDDKYVTTKYGRAVGLSKSIRTELSRAELYRIDDVPFSMAAGGKAVLCVGGVQVITKQIPKTYDKTRVIGTKYP